MHYLKQPAIFVMTTRCIGRTKKFLSGLTTHQPLTPFLWSDAGSANIVARTKLYPEIGDTAVIEILTQHYVKTQIISAHAEKGRTVLAYVFRNRPPL